GRITAAAWTGPASGPRPASSTPARSSRPRSQKLCSRARSCFSRRRSRRRLAPRRVRPMRPRAGVSALALLADPGRLAPQAAQVVELRAANPPAPQQLDRIDRRRVDREDPLDADPARDLAHGEALADPRPTAADAHALEGLDPLLLPLAHAHAPADRVAGTELRQVVPDLRL